MFANCILFAIFCSMGTLVRRKKTWRYSTRKVTKFGQLKIDILVYVSCKFEMYTFKISRVISENVRIAFLYVLSIQSNPNPVQTGVFCLVYMPFFMGMTILLTKPVLSISYQTKVS